MGARRLALLGAVAMLGLGATSRAAVPSAAARYVSLKPFELALMADVIVDGTIVKFDAARPEWGSTAAFTIRINEVIAGESPGETLRVFEFIDWTCAGRYAPYENGQRAVFHLERTRNDAGQMVPDAPLRVLGSGNEGECPVVDDRMFHRPTGWSIEGLDRQERTVHGYTWFCVASAKAEYTSSIVGLRKCYRWDRDPRESRGWFPHGTLNQLCSDEELAAFEASSDVANRFMKGVREYLER